MKLINKRPDDIKGRLDKEIKVYDLLDSLDINYDYLYHKAISSVEEGREVSSFLDAMVCKNLFLCNSKKDKYYLLLIPEDKKFNSSKVSKMIGSTRLSFGSPSKMEEYLNVTPGSVTIMALMNDLDNKVQLIVDEEVIHSEYFACHPCVNTTSLRMKTNDVFDKFIDKVNHKKIVINL